MKPSTISICLILLATSSRLLHAQDKGAFEPMDVFRLEFAADPQISPDGKRVVYVRNFMDIKKDRRRSNLWIIHVDGSEHRALTSGDGTDRLPRWSHDSKRLLYLSGEGELMCRWMDTGNVGRLAKLPAEPLGIAWSPDSKSIAFTMHVAEASKPFVKLPTPPKGAEWAEPPVMIRSLNYRVDGQGYLKEGHSHLFVLPSDGGTPRQHTKGAYDHVGTPAWTPDSKAVLVTGNRHPDGGHDPLNTEIYEVTVADGSLKVLTDRKGPDNNPVVSPDGKQIAYTGFDDKQLGYQVTRLYVMNRDGSNPRLYPMDRLDRDVKNPLWSKNGELFFQFDDEANTKVMTAKFPEALADNVGGTTLDRPYSSGSYSVSDNGTIAFTLTSPSHPAEVAIHSVKDKRPTRLTNLSASLFDQRKLATIEEIRYKSSHDGRMIHGWLVKPAGFDPKKKYPLILEIHGGPFANYGPRFAAQMQLYAAAGYVVFYANPRGSTSYGQEFGNLIHHAYPGHDYDDLMSGVDAVIEKGYIDTNNLFVTGGSGGGVLTAWIIGKTGRFRAAVVSKPVINWFSFVLTADIYAFFNRYWFPGPPWEHAEHYFKRSPISLAGKITTPTMIITGEADHRTPISESEQLYQALKLRKIDSALVRIPGASHDIAARPSHLIAHTAYVLEWFETHRKK
jgi:dipeptidyl aminopeptidase/acylaminoacyl peptidase